MRVFYTDGGNTVENVVSEPTAEVTSANQDPVANDDSGITTNGMSQFIDVLNNDSDPDGDSLTLESVEQPSNGTASIVTPLGSGPRVSYTPEPGFTGSDSFTYQISDGNGGTATGTVNVQVREPPGDGGIGDGGIGDGGGKIPPGDGGGGVIVVPPPVVIIASQISPDGSIAEGGERTMTGTDDSDIFQFSQGDGAVIIEGFQQGTSTEGEAADQIQLAGFGLTFADLDSNGDGLVDVGDDGVLSSGGGPVGISFGGGDTLSVNGVSALTEDDFLFV